MNAPRQESKEPKGLVLPFRRREKPRPQGDAPIEGLEKYAEPSEPDDYRQRMINNGLGLLACILLVIGGIWIANTMAEMRRNQDCVLSGRRNCAPIPAPSAGPTK